MQFTVVANKSNRELRWQGASYSGAHPVFVFMETPAVPSSFAGCLPYHPCGRRLFHRTSCLCPFCLTALLQWSVVLSYDKVWDVFRWKQGIHSVFQRTQKIRTCFRLEKGSGFSFSSGTTTKAPVDGVKLRYLVIDRKPITRFGGYDYEVR